MKKLLQRAAEGAGLSDGNLHIILDAMPTPLSWATIDDGLVRFTNRAFESIFGFTEADFPSMRDWFEATGPLVSQREFLWSRWQAALDDASQDIGTIGPLELQIRCTSGEIRTVQHRGTVLHALGIAIATFADITHRKAAEEALRRIALEDPLTGLANRRVLQDRWQEMTQSSGSRINAALLLIDLDGFKALNDSFGHDAGDEALVIVSDRLRDCVRAGDLVCRMGGDEFAILLPPAVSRERVEALCETICDRLSQPFTLAGETASVGVSIGASLFPEDGASLHDILKRADEALYRLKHGEKGGWQWFQLPQT